LSRYDVFVSSDIISLFSSLAYVLPTLFIPYKLLSTNVVAFCPDPLGGRMHSLNKLNWKQEAQLLLR